MINPSHKHLVSYDGELLDAPVGLMYNVAPS